MIYLPDVLAIKNLVRFIDELSEKSFKTYVLMFLTTLVLGACSHVNHDHLAAGASDYSHYPAGGGLFVSTAFGPDGRLWRIVPEKHQVYVDFSSDFGKTFSTPVLVNTETQQIKVSGENRPGIAVDRAGRIFVIYAAESSQPVTVYFSVSADNGHSFSKPMPLSGKAPEANSFQGRLAVNSAGQVYVFWHDERNRTDWRQAGNAVYYTTINGQTGLNFAAQKLSDTLCDCCRIAAAFDSKDQPVLMARFIYPGGIRDHGLIKPQADNKKPLEWRVTFDQWTIEACPDHGPAIAISDELYHIAWFTQGTDRQGLFYANSTDHGQHFSVPLALGDPRQLPAHPDVIAQSQTIALTWIEFDGTKTQLKVMQSNNGGKTWLASKVIAQSNAEVDYPFLLRNNKDIFVSWNTKNEGFRLIPLN